MDINSLKKDIQAIREKSPLVHNITNYVVMNNTANALLALGASPVMAHAIDEVEEMAQIASALVLNIGTLSNEWVEAMIIAGKAAAKRNIPIVLDPVGAGATQYRTEICRRIIYECNPNVIRANASEVMALSITCANDSIKSKGVDSIASSNMAIDSAQALAISSNAVVVISGQTDYICNGNRIEKVTYGSPIMTKVTGLGCTASALTGAFVAVNNNLLDACVNAMTIMGMAGEEAAAKSAGPGSLQVNFIDNLYNSNILLNKFQ